MNPAVTLALACAAAAAGAGCEARAQGGAGSVAGSAPAAGPAPNLPVPLVLPSDWKPIEVAAEAGRAAAGPGVGGRIPTVRTWGDTGLGCFVTVVEVGGRTPQRANASGVNAVGREAAEPLARIAAELETTLAGLLTVEQWTLVDGPAAEVTARIARPPMRGALRGRLLADAAGVPHAAVAACFYNEREPVRCQATCTELLAGLEAPRVTP